MADTTPPLVFNPGPTALHASVPGEMAAAVADGFLSESHRGQRFRAEVQRATEAVREVLEVPSEHRIVFLGSASESMERLIQGAVRRRSGHLVNGAFARRFRDVAANLGREVEALEVADGEGFHGDEAIPEGVELLALTQNETSTGVRISPEAVHRVADRARDSGALVAVDMVSGWPAEKLDPARIDAAFFSVQKGFGLPAGLGVMTVSPALADRALELQREGHSTGGYFHLPALVAAADRSQTVGTPNMLAIRLLGRVAEDYLDRGITVIRRETQDNAGAVWDAVGRTEGLAPFVADREIRSRTVLVLDVEGGSESLRSALRKRGLVVGDGYGPRKGRQIRIANFPVQTTEMIQALVDVLVTLR